MNSLLCKKNKEGKENHFGSFLKNEKLNAAVNRITDHIVDRATKGIDNVINKIFTAKKHHSAE